MPANIQQQIEQLIHEVARLYEQGRYEDAVSASFQAYDLARQHLGKNHPDYVAIMNNLFVLYYQQIDHLKHQVAQLCEQGHYKQAIRPALETCDLTRQQLGEAHPDYAAALDNLAAVYQGTSDFARAEPLCRQALDVYKQALGETHPNYFASLSNLAVLYKEMGDYARAVPLYRRALEACKKALGDTHPNYAICLNNLGMFYRDTGDYVRAERLFRRALDVYEKAPEETRSAYVATLINLAGLYRQMGDYARAEPLCRQALDVCKRGLGEKHPRFADILSNLAPLYWEMGDYARAEPLYRQALEFYKKTLGEQHPRFATILHDLAMLYRELGDCARAEPLCRQALEIRRRTLGNGHRDYAQSLDGLAALYREMGDYARAEPLYRQALEVYRKALGEQHPYSGDILNSLAALYWEMGDYARAEPLYRQALEVCRKALGEQHPRFATRLNNLAVLYIAGGYELDAFPLMRQATTIHDRLIGQVFSIGSDSQRTAFLTNVRSDTDGFLSLVSQYLRQSPDAVRVALELVLRRKAITAEVLGVQRDAVLGGKYPTLEPLLRQWAGLRMQIARMTLAGPGPEGLQAHHHQLAQWTNQREQLEAELARQIPEMKLEEKLQKSDRCAVALALPAGVALVEFVRFHVCDFKAVARQISPSEWLRPQMWQSARYLAFVLPAGKPDQVQMLDLGEAEPIDRLIAAFRADLTDLTVDRSGRDLSKAQAEPAAPASDDIGRSLRAAVFDKLVPALSGRRLLLAPDGDLARLPFEVLPTDDGRHLLDDYQISYLSTGRDVLRFGVQSGRSPAEPLVIADPDFDMADDSAPAPQPMSESNREWRHSRDLDRNHYHFSRLPGTHVEGKEIAGMLGVRPWLEETALEGRLKACRSPRILHLATHGFFLPDQQRDPNELPRGLEPVAWATEPGMGRLSGPGMENPLLRSGLALSGANTWLRNGNLPPEAEDGLLTAEDVSGLDLLDTELVVLSACDTGLGEVHVGEGVFGLRRAFVLAGAKTLIMSLWKVSDLPTALLMERFYENLLGRGQARDESLREAQMYTRDVTVGKIRQQWLSPDRIERLSAGNDAAKRHLQELAAQPDDHRPFTSPFYWGAFICQGDPSPLPGATL